MFVLYNPLLRMTLISSGTGRTGASRSVCEAQVTSVHLGGHWFNCSSLQKLTETSFCWLVITVGNMTHLWGQNTKKTKSLGWWRATQNVGVLSKRQHQKILSRDLAGLFFSVQEGRLENAKISF